MPNLCHDGHDCSTQVADAWLASTIPSIVGSPWYRAGGVLTLTWDEGSLGGCCNGAVGGHIATIVVSASVRAGSSLATPVDHAGILRTVETIYGLPYLGLASCTCSGSLMGLVSSG